MPFPPVRLAHQSGSTLPLPKPWFELMFILNILLFFHGSRTRVYASSIHVSKYDCTKNVQYMNERPYLGDCLTCSIFSFTSPQYEEKMERFTAKRWNEDVKAEF